MSDDIRPFRVEVPQDGARRSPRPARSHALARPDPELGLGLRDRPGVPARALRDVANHVRLARRRKRGSTSGRTSSPTSTASRSTSSTRVRRNRTRSRLVITHGWPGSVSEFLDIIDPLCNPRAHGGDPKDAFHVVCPSIPGYGWSGPTTQPGWDVLRVANAWKELMARLGYERYGAQGGDWGAIISATLATVDDDARRRVAQQHAAGVPGQRGRAVADRGRGRRPRGGRRIHAARERVSGDPGQEPADARLRAHRFTRGARGLDRREVLRMDRPRR